MVQKISSRADNQLNVILTDILNNTTQELYDQLITIIQYTIQNLCGIQEHINSVIVLLWRTQSSWEIMLNRTFIRTYR